MGNKILVLNGDSYASAVVGLGDIVTNVNKFLAAPEDFKVVLFTGGADINPVHYGDTSPKNICYCNPRRDIEEIKVAKLASKMGILMTGICRGLQLLNVFAGGTMMHDLKGHGFGDHEMTTLAGKTITVNSLHHQMILPPVGAAIVTGWTPKRLSPLYSFKSYIGANDEYVDYTGVEVEASIYPAIRALGVQYHPEMMYKESDGYKYFYAMIAHALSVPWEEFVASHQEMEHETLHKYNCTAGR